MTSRAWQRYLIAGSLVGLAYLLLPQTPTMKLALYNGLGLSAVLAILVGIRRNRPEHARPWYCFAAGQTMFLLGDLVFYTYQDILKIESPFPSLADAGYLGSYPFLVAGLLLIMRRRTPGGDRASLIDALIVATSIGVLSWIFLMQPYAHDPSLTLAQRLISLAYPTMDVLLLAVAVRMTVGGGARSPAFTLMSGSVVALLTADTLYGVTQLTGNYQTGDLMDLGWLAFYLLWGAAALHPSMGELSRPVPGTFWRLSRPRLVGLAAVSVAGPLVVVVETARGLAMDVPVVVGAAGVLFLLTLGRMAGLVLALEATLSELERAGERDRVFSAAGSALVGAADRDDICSAAAEAAAALIPEREQPLVRVAVLVDGTLIEAARSAHVHGDVPDVTALGDALSDRHTVLEPTVVSEADGSRTFLVPLWVQDRLGGVLAVTTRRELSRSDRHAVATLGSQVSLALESAALVEDLHRRQSEQRFRSLVQSASDVITIVDPDGTIRYQSPSVERVLGYREAELVDRHLRDLLHPEDVTAMNAYIDHVASQHGDVLPPIESRIRHASGAWRAIETVGSNLLADPNVAGIVLTTRDVSDRKALEEQLTRQAFHDPLTGLANRLLLADRVQHALERRHGNRELLSVIFIDLDDFKTVNDSLGHGAGDELLVAVARRLEGCLRSADTAARLGGDEFAILLEGTTGPEGAQVCADRILDALTAPFTLLGKEVAVTASVGIAVLDDASGQSADVLLRNADAAMYFAKSKGKNRAELFEPSMHARVLERLELKADLQRAVANDELVLHYQPMVDLRTGDLVGVEALVRWRHPRRGLVPPAGFICLAEETGLIVEVGRWVLREACRQAREWQGSMPPGTPLLLSVNLSARQLQDSALFDDVADCLAQTGLDPSSLILEITETTLMHDTDATMEKLQRLKSLGLSLAIDDFGTGYSSLAYLQRFPVDVIKIDKSFVGSFVGGPEETKLAQGILHLAKSLRVTTVAEGIEVPEQLVGLQGLACHYGQGYLFSPPVEASAVGLLLDRRAPCGPDGAFPLAEQGESVPAATSPPEQTSSLAPTTIA